MSQVVIDDVLNAEPLTGGNRSTEAAHLVKGATIILGLSSLLLGVEATSAPVTSQSDFHSVAAQHWTNESFVKRASFAPSWNYTTGLSSQASPPIAENVALNSAAQVLWLHRESGLTWDQLARTMGVSRRALHAWASGQRLAASNAERVDSIYRVIHSLPMTTKDDRRSALLISTGIEGSTFERWCNEVTVGRAATIPVSALERVGAAEA